MATLWHELELELTGTVLAGGPSGDRLTPDDPGEVTDIRVIPTDQMVQEMSRLGVTQKELLRVLTVLVPDFWEHAESILVEEDREE